MSTESNQIENYVNNVKEQIMNTTQQNNSDEDMSGGMYYFNVHWHEKVFLSLNDVCLNY